MDPTRKISLITRWLFIITFVTGSHQRCCCTSPVLDDARYIVGAGAGSRIALGAPLERSSAVAG
jgi:hypothetical protein